MARVIVGINDTGSRIGQDHHNAVLTDTDVDLMLKLRAQDQDAWSYAVLAAKFEVSKSLVAQICRLEKRSQMATRWKVIERA